MWHNVTWCNHNMCAMMWDHGLTQCDQTAIDSGNTRQIMTDLDSKNTGRVTSPQCLDWTCTNSHISRCNIHKKYVILGVIRSHSGHCQDCQVWSGCLSPKATANFLFCIYSTHFNSAICFQYAWNWRGDTLSLWLSAMQFWVFPKTGDIRRHFRSCRKKTNPFALISPRNMPKQANPAKRRWWIHTLMTNYVSKLTPQAKTKPNSSEDRWK